MKKDERNQDKIKDNIVKEKKEKRLRKRKNNKQLWKIGKAEEVEIQR